MTHAHIQLLFFLQTLQILKAPVDDEGDDAKSGEFVPPY